MQITVDYDVPSMGGSDVFSTETLISANQWSAPIEVSGVPKFVSWTTFSYTSTTGVVATSRTADMDKKTITKSRDYLGTRGNWVDLTETFDDRIKYTDNSISIYNASGISRHATISIFY